MRSKYTEPSKTLNHYEKYNIYEMARFDGSVPIDTLYNLIDENEECSSFVKNNMDMLLVTVGCFKSLLIRLPQQKDNHPHANEGINSPEKRLLRRKDWRQFSWVAHFLHI